MYILNNIVFLWRESLQEQNLFCDVAVAESTVMWLHRFILLHKIIMQTGILQGQVSGFWKDLAVWKLIPQFNWAVFH